MRYTIELSGGIPIILNRPTYEDARREVQLFLEATNSSQTIIDPIVDKSSD